MELSLLKLQDVAAGRPVGERRRHVRHPLHSPVYASFDRPSAGMVLDLSELLDLSEDGFSVQTSPPLEVNKTLNFSLDLPETKAFIHCTGQVVWSDRGGRGGIRFAGLQETSKRAIKEWLLVNLLQAATRHAARSIVAAALVEEEKTRKPTLATSEAVPAVIPDLTGMLSAVEAVRREVRATGNFDAALQLIAERALSLTGAAGAALAFLTADKMTCRASSGEPAMPLGTAVDIKHGVTGECVRSGRMVTCEDVETDERVDREICRLLGIGSILATPIVSDFKVVGLLEVFSPSPRAFTDVHEIALDRLVELVPKAPPIAMLTQGVAAEVIALAPSHPVPEFAPALHSTREAVWEPEREAQEPLRGVPVRLTHIVLLVVTLAVLFVFAGYKSAPRIERWLSQRASASSAAVPSPVMPPVSKAVTPSMPFDELRQLAEGGDTFAQYSLGSRYHNGEGVPQDDVQAMRWFERAADQGYAAAQATAGAYYWAGRGVPKDLGKSYFWSTLALRQGDASSESRLQGLELQMSRAQVAAAQAQADEWARQRRAAK